jgi:Protein of unknown function (DUF3617)
MKRGFWYGALMASVALGGTMTSALAAPLDVKPGLWEMTIHTETHGQLPVPPEVLQKLSPERRAAMEEKMKARNSQPHAHVYKDCITQQKLDKDEDSFLAGEPDMKCESKLSKHTRNSIAGTRHCTKGSVQQTEDLVFEAQDREHITGKVNVSVRNGTNTMTSKGNLSGHWISALCGKTP